MMKKTMIGSGVLRLAAGTAISLACGGLTYAQAAVSPQGQAPDSTTPVSSVAAPAKQNAAGDNLEEIVVSARRANETLMSVPVAVSVVSRATLVTNNVASLTDLPDLAPFVSIQKTPTGTGAQFVIRGIGSPDGDVGVQQTVLINIDNVLIGRGRIIDQALFDLDQVEVLKGPQALFFGKNSPAGVVSLTTASPGNEFGGYIRSGYEFESDERFVDAAVDIPLTPTFAIRLAGHGSKSEGYIENTAPAEPNPFAPPQFALTGAAHERLPGGSDAIGRLTAKWTPSDSFTATLKYTQGDTDNNGEDSPYEVFCKPGITHPSDYGVPDPNSDCKFNGRVSFGSFPRGLTVNMPSANGGQQYGHVESAVSSLTLQYTADNFSLDSITGYYRLNNKSSGIFDGTSYAAIYVVALEQANSVSQELRLSSKLDGPLNYTLGGYVGSSTDDNVSEAFLGYGGPDPTTGRYYTYDRSSSATTDTRSVFAQGRWDIVSNLEFAAGARYTLETVNSVDGNTYVNQSPTFAFLRPEGSLFVRTYQGNNTSPEATLTWHPTPDQTLYGAYKTGYKSGGFSYPSVLSVIYTAANTTFKPEKAQGGEIGYKSFLFNRKLSAEVTVYNYTFSDLQVSSFDAADLSFIVGNAAKARTRGIELQSRYRPFGGLTFDGSIGYNQAEYISFPTAACYHGQTVAQGCSGAAQDLSGRTLPRAPSVQGNIAANYDINLNSLLKLNLNVRASYTGRYNAQDTLDPYTEQNAFWKIDAGIGLATQDDRWTVSLIGRNLGNKYVLLFSQDKALGTPGQYNGVPDRPRQVLLQAAYKF